MVLSWVIILVLLVVILLTNLFYSFRSKILLLVSLALVLLIPFVSFLVAYSISNYADSKALADRVIVVLGAGIRNDTPTEILKRRLETAKEIYNITKSKIIVTGDNSQEYHNEPRVMKNYLIRLGVPSTNITEDFGGRRTMDSCYRVKNFFNVSKIVLVSQAFHLPRARFLCESVGLSVQTKAAQDSGTSSVTWGYIREIPASWPAIVDSVYFKPQVGSDGSETID